MSQFLAFKKGKILYCLAVFVFVSAIASSPKAVEAASPVIQNVAFGHDTGGNFIALDWINTAPPKTGCERDVVAVWLNRFSPNGTTTDALITASSHVNGDFEPNNVPSYASFGKYGFASGYPRATCGTAEPDLEVALPKTLKAYIDPSVPPNKSSFSSSDFITVQIIRGVYNIGYATLLYNDPAKYYFKTQEPIIFLPGILGSKLNKSSDNSEVWPNTAELLKTKDTFLDELILDDAGEELSGHEIKIDGVLASAGPKNIYKNILDALTSFASSSGAFFSPNPYDWRAEIKNSANELSKNALLVSAGSSNGKFNFIAHSMGGLVTKEYLRQTTDTKKIDKAIFMGTPNLGAPKAAKIILEGDDLDISILGVAGLNTAEVKKISQNFPSIYELLPSKKYFAASGGYIADSRSGSIGSAFGYDQTASFMQNYDPTFNAGLFANATTFHDNLDNAPLPANVRAFNIVGCGNTNTIGSLRLQDDNSFRIDYTIGDKTVPLTSAIAIPGTEKTYFSRAEHMGLVKDPGVLEQITNILNDTPDILAQGISTSSASCAFSQKKIALATHSPVTLDVYDSQNNHLGPNSLGDIEYGIPDSSYDVIGDNNFVTVPDSTTTTYKVVIKAYAAGSFDFDISPMTGAAFTQRSSYLNQPITTSTIATLTYTPGAAAPQLSIDTDGNGTIDKTALPNAAVSGAGLDDITPPTITATLAPNDFAFTRNQIVAVAAAATDNESGIALFRSTLDGEPFSTSTIDLFYQHLGAHTINHLAYDKAGNPRTLDQNFEIYADTTSTIADVERAFTLGWITKKTVKNELLSTLKSIMHLEKRIFKLQAKLPPPAPGKMTPAQKIQKQIDRLVATIDKKLGKTFLGELDKRHAAKSLTDEGYELLREDLSYMMQ